MKTVKNILLSYKMIKFALVFGSYANNSSHNFSDYDVAIYTDEELDLFSIGEIINALESVVDKKVDLVLLHDLYKKNPKLAFNITSNHKIIFSLDDRLYNDFKTKSLLYYFDTKPMYDLFDKKLKERLKNGTFGQIKTT